MWSTLPPPFTLVTFTVSLKVAVASTTSPMAYLPSAPALLVMLTDETVGAVSC